MRLDLFASLKLNISRNKASELIKSGKILINGRVLNKPSIEVSNEAEILLSDDVYVGRGALKLKGFLQDFSIEISGKNALDIGSSTGGFVQILLQNNASSVTALDVGSNQLNQSLRDDFRVKVRENSDIREFSQDSKFDDVKNRFDIVTCDVSFISATSILPHIARVARGEIIVLFKPQFEVGREAKRNKKGVVMDEKAVKMAMMKFELEAAKLGLILKICKPCEIKGKEGNAEFFYAFNKV